MEIKGVGAENGRKMILAPPVCPLCTIKLSKVPYLGALQYLLGITRMWRSAGFEKEGDTDKYARSTSCMGHMG